MFKDTPAFSGFAVDDLAVAKDFYSTVLGLQFTETENGVYLELSGGGRVFIYEKAQHTPATFTVLNFAVSDLDATVEGLTERGVAFEQYSSTDEMGVARDVDPPIAWFKDPAGNILSVLQH